MEENIDRELKLISVNLYKRNLPIRHLFEELKAIYDISKLPEKYRINAFYNIWNSHMPSSAYRKELIAFLVGKDFS
jgi:hypothetical protein